MALSLRMRRLPKMDRHKSGQGRVRIKGRSYYCGAYGTPEAAERYKRLLAEYVTNGDVARESPDADGFTVAELLLRFWEKHVQVAYRKNGKPTSEVSLFKSAIGMVQAHYASLPVNDFSPKCLRTLRDLMVMPTEAGGMNWTRDSANAQCRRIRQAFRWGVEHEMVRPEVLQALAAVRGLRKGKTAARENRKVKPVPMRDLLGALRQLPTVVQDMVRFQIRTGCRPGEVCQLRPCDIQRSGEVWEYVPESHKTEHHGQQRRIPIGPKARRVLTEYLENRRDTEHCFSPRESENERLEKLHAARRTPMSCGNRPGSNRKAKPKRSVGTQWKTVTYGRAIQRACKAADVSHWTPNQLRHTAATMIRKRYGIEASQVILGHSNARVTEIYAERDFAKAREIAAAMG